MTEWENNYIEYLDADIDGITGAKTETDKEQLRTDYLNSFDFVFFIIVNTEEKGKILKKALTETICRDIASYLRAETYTVQGGETIRHSSALRTAFDLIIPFKIGMIYVDPDNDDCYLLSDPQRDAFYDRIMDSREDEDTLDILKKVQKEVR